MRYIRMSIIRMRKAIRLFDRPNSKRVTALYKRSSEPLRVQALTKACAERSTRSSAGCSSVAGRSLPRVRPSIYSDKYCTPREVSASAVISASERQCRWSLRVLISRCRVSTDSYERSAALMAGKNNYSRKKGNGSRECFAIVQKMQFVGQGSPSNLQNSTPCHRTVRNSPLLS